MSQRWPIRTHLLVVALAAGLVLAGLFAHMVYTHADDEARQARQATLNLVHLIATYTRQFFADSETWLGLVAHRSSAQTIDLRICSSLSNDLLKNRFADMAVLDLSGKVVCSVTAGSGRFVATGIESPWFRKVLRFDAFVTGEPVVDPGTGRWVLALAYPLHDSHDQIAAVLTTTLDLAGHSFIPGSIDLPPGSVITIVDNNGTVITRLPDPEKWSGRNGRGAEIVDAVLAQPEGQMQAHGIDGVDKFYGFAAIPGTNWHVYVGIPIQFAPLDASAIRDVLLALAGLLAVAGLALYVGRQIEQPIHRLAKATIAASEGRVEVPVGGPLELVQVATQFSTMLDVQHQHERELQDSKARYRRFIETAQEGIWEINADNRTVFVNEKMADMIGYTVEEMLDRPIRAFMDDEGRSIAAARLEQRTKDAAGYQDFKFCRKDGADLWAIVSAAPVLDGNGTYRGALLMVVDITERRRADEALRSSEDRFSKAFHASPVTISITRLVDGRFIDVNESWLRIAGYSRDEVVGRTSSELRIWAALDEREQMLKILQEQGTVRDHVIQFRTKPGEIRIALLSVEVIKLNGEDCLLHLAYDITERKRAEEALRVSEAAQREQRILAEALRDTAAALTSTLDLDMVMSRILENVGHVVPHDAANVMLIDGEVARVLHWAGYPPEIGANLAMYDFPLETMPKLRQMLATGRSCLVTHTRTDPEWVKVDMAHSGWIGSYVGAPIRVRDQVIGFLNLDSRQPGFFTAIHAERLQAFADQAAIAIHNARLYDELRRYAAELERRVERRTAELRRAKEHVEAILNNSSDAIVVIRGDGTIQQINQAFDSAFGYRPGEAAGQLASLLVKPDCVEDLMNALNDALTSNQPWRLEVTACRKDGTLFNADVALAPILERATRPTGVVCSIRDITALKQVETELRRALERERELNELKSRFVSMVSHEFRTPLTTILFASNLLKKHNHRLTDEQRRARLDNIQAEIEHLNRLLEDVLTIGRAEAGRLDMKPESINLEVFCRTIVAKRQTAVPTTHRIAFSCTGDCSAFMGDAKLLRQVLDNLLSNAVKYSPPGSIVYFDLACQADKAVFRVRDAGIGIPATDRGRIFEAFYRADNVGQISGTGLGLAIAKQAIELHGGAISVESEVGVGTTFTVIIPNATA